MFTLGSAAQASLSPAFSQVMRQSFLAKLLIFSDVILTWLAYYTPTSYYVVSSLAGDDLNQHCAGWRGMMIFALLTSIPTTCAYFQYLGDYFAQGCDALGSQCSRRHGWWASSAARPLLSQSQSAIQGGQQHDVAVSSSTTPSLSMQA